MVFCDIASFYTRRGGGVATYHNQKLAFFADCPEHRYAIIAPSEKEGIERSPGGTIYWLRGFRFDANYRHLFHVPALRRILRIIRPDVLEFGSPYLDYWVGVRAAKGLDIVQTALYHCDFPDTYIRPFLDRYVAPLKRPVLRFLYGYVKHVYRRLDCTFVASRYIQAKLNAAGLTNLVYLPLGIDSEAFNPNLRDVSLRRALGVMDEEKILLYVGRYRAEKGIDLLLQALPSFPDKSAIHFIFVGAGPLKNRVQMWASRRRTVHDLGFVSDREYLARLYASSDGFISPGHQETFGLGICEALASGVPVLSADAGGGAEMVSRFPCGLLFKAGDISDLVRKAQILIRSDFRPGIAMARKYLASHHSWDRILRVYVDHHEKLKARKEKGDSLHP